MIIRILSVIPPLLLIPLQPVYQTHLQSSSQTSSRYSQTLTKAVTLNNLSKSLKRSMSVTIPIPPDVSTVLCKTALLLFTKFSSRSTPGSKTNEIPDQLKLGTISLLNTNYTVSFTLATLEPSNMASGKKESSIFSKEGPSHHNKFPNNTVGVTWRVAMPAWFWSVLTYLQ